MTINLLDNTLHIEVFYERDDQDLEDNICVSIIESCPPQERIMRSGETHIYLTAHQACQLGEALLTAARLSEANTGEQGSKTPCD